jgi:hypothetical protein
MPFFPVDDALWGHPKADAAGDAALGLWTRAGSYCANYLTEGAITAAELRKLRARPSQIRALVDAGLWHPHGHRCDRCPQPPTGGYQFHEWNKNGNRTRAQVQADRAAAAERQRRARQRQSQPDPPPPDTSRRDSPRDTGTSHAVSHTAQARPGQATTPLLTLVGRLAVGDAREPMRPPAEQIALWQDIAGPGVDLEDEARRYLERNLGRPANDEAAAWIGWLRKGAERRAAFPRPRPQCTHAACHRGWLPEFDGRPVPCPTCRPHLQPVRGETA